MISSHNSGGNATESSSAGGLGRDTVRVCQSFDKIYYWWGQLTVVPAGRVRSRVGPWARYSGTASSRHCASRSKTYLAWVLFQTTQQYFSLSLPLFLSVDC